MVTKDPATLPEKSTRYLATNLPRPGSPWARRCEHPPADLGEVVHIHGIRNWIEQGYRHVKGELAWADFQVCSDTAIRLSPIGGTGRVDLHHPCNQLLVI